ncbi:Translation initiation factor IF- 2 domain 3, partial [Trinorchestia longiramus]
MVNLLKQETVVMVNLLKQETVVMVNLLKQETVVMVNLLKNVRYRARLNKTGMRPKETEDTDMGPSVAMLLKCDVQGSLEAIIQVLETYESESVRLDLVTSGVGPVTQSDVQLAQTFGVVTSSWPKLLVVSGDVKLAQTFGATIFAFNVSNDRGIEEVAHEASVPIVHTNIIYRLVEHLRQLLTKQMPTLPQEEVLGEAEVLEQFMASDGGRKKTPVAGCRCVKGTLKKDANFRLYRENELIHEGPLLSMRHVKSEVGTIGTDKECGLKFEDRSVSFQKGDRIVCYTIHQLEQETSEKKVSVRRKKSDLRQAVQAADDSTLAWLAQYLQERGYPQPYPFKRNFEEERVKWINM